MIVEVCTDWKVTLTHKEMIFLAILCQCYVENNKEPVHMRNYDFSDFDYGTPHEIYKNMEALTRKGYAIKHKTEGKKNVHFAPNTERLGTYFENLELKYWFKD